MKLFTSAICSLVVLFSCASMVEACEDMPLFTVYTVNGAEYFDSDEFYYNPDRNEFIVVPLYSNGKGIRFNAATTIMACCDGEFEVRDGKLYFHPSYYNALGISITYTMPFDTEKQCFIAERELMDAIATSCKYGTSKEDLSAYFNKHFTIVGIK